ncbi:DUF2934 domain-containing protein [Methylobacterium sp. R2-1]|uniref:DUF2934 domain-containing protein n=1 Tax=Methylobacterium sp. R2-1 TaxID=2587064 RepID=UPI0028B133A0|nr:DUF2934 domain-containing protein [Methylobacterium sp. R2-1]
MGLAAVCRFLVPMPQAEPPITPAEIRQRAYELWERNHQPEGFEVEFWLLAERELRAERRAKQPQQATPDNFVS